MIWKWLIKKHFLLVNLQHSKSSLDKAPNDGMIEGLVKCNSNAAKFEVKAGDMTMAKLIYGVVAAETVVPDFKFDPSRSVHIRNLIPTVQLMHKLLDSLKNLLMMIGAAATAQMVQLLDSLTSILLRLQ